MHAINNKNNLFLCQVAHIEIISLLFNNSQLESIKTSISINFIFYTFPNYFNYCLHDKYMGITYLRACRKVGGGRYCGAWKNFAIHC